MSLETLLIWEAAAEMTTAILCFILNIYFSYRFGKLSTFNRNLRLILVFVHIVTAIFTLVHPILVHIPPQFYSIANGRYFEAALVYSLFFIVQACVILLVTKFMLIAIERRFAFTHRIVYENADFSVARRLIYFVVNALVCFKIQKQSKI